MADDKKPEDKKPEDKKPEAKAAEKPTKDKPSAPAATGGAGAALDKQPTATPPSHAGDMKAQVASSEEVKDDKKPTVDSWMGGYLDSNPDFNADEGSAIDALIAAAKEAGFDDAALDDYLMQTEDTIASDEGATPEQLDEEEKQMLRDQYGAKFPGDTGYEAPAPQAGTTPEKGFTGHDIPAYSSDKDPTISHSGKLGGGGNPLAKLIASFRV
jgi:hypothetical protein